MPQQATLRTLTPREQQLLAPMLQEFVEAQQRYQHADEHLRRCLLLAEPAFEDPAVDFDIATMSFRVVVASGISDTPAAAPAADMPAPAVDVPSQE